MYVRPFGGGEINRPRRQLGRARTITRERPRSCRVLFAQRARFLNGRSGDKNPATSIVDSHFRLLPRPPTLSILHRIAIFYATL
uniref:Uncharacterized protein n=1 Tax=Strigamia maritima TaxID=126957 RepID=T1JBN2_STRMM